MFCRLLRWKKFPMRLFCVDIHKLFGLSLLSRRTGTAARHLHVALRRYSIGIVSSSLLFTQHVIIDRKQIDECVRVLFQIPCNPKQMVDWMEPICVLYNVCLAVLHARWLRRRLCQTYKITCAHPPPYHPPQANQPTTPAALYPLTNALGTWLDRDE